MTPAQTTRAQQADLIDTIADASESSPPIYSFMEVDALHAGAAALRELHAGEASVTTHHAEARTHLRQWLAEDAQPSAVEELEALVKADYRRMLCGWTTTTRHEHLLADIKAALLEKEKNRMSQPDDHYRYEHTRDPERAPRPPWRVRALVNVGHDGSILNCSHPACAALREKETR